MNFQDGLISIGKISLLDDHTSFALSQNQKIWHADSGSFPQASQRLSLVMRLFHKFSFMAKMSLHALHAKCLIVFGTRIFQRSLQTCSRAAGFELSGEFPSVDISWASLYALLTVNFPFLLSAHIRWSLAPCVLSGMLKIASTSWVRKTWRISWSFHSIRSSSIRSHTRVTYRSGFSGVTTLYVLGLWSHLSLHIWTCSPLPTYHLTPLLTIAWAANILLQAKDGWLPKVASRKLHLGKHLALYTL